MDERNIDSGRDDLEFEGRDGPFWKQQIEQAEPSRPAKAVQGEKTVDELVMLIGRLVHKSRNIPEMADLRAKTLDYLQRKNLTPSPLRDGAALTPESEGIAGKGEGLARANELLDRIEIQCNAVGHPVGGIDELKSLFAGTHALARPQEIDVEAIKWELEIYTAGKWERESENGKRKHHHLGGLNTKAISDIIDYLAANYTIRGKE